MIRIEGFGIAADSHGYTVGKPVVYTNKETGTESETLASPRYFGNMKDCLKYIRKQMHYEAIKNIDGDINAAIKAVADVDKRFEKLIDGVEKE